MVVMCIVFGLLERDALALNTVVIYYITAT